MNEKQVFEKLGLPPTFSKNEIKKNFRKLYKIAQEKGDHEEMILLIEAYKIALSSLQNNYLIPIELVDRITNKVLEIYNLKEAEKESTRRTLNIIIKRKKTKIRKARRNATYVAFVSGLIIFLVPRLLSRIENMEPFVTIIFSAITVISIFIAYTYQMRAEEIESIVSDISEALNNKDILAKLFYNSIPDSDRNKSLSRYQLSSKIDKWIYQKDNHELNEGKQRIESFIREMGVKDFVDILIKKGIENKFINERLMDDGEVKYFLRIIKI